MTGRTCIFFGGHQFQKGAVIVQFGPAAGSGLDLRPRSGVRPEQNNAPAVDVLIEIDGDIRNARAPEKRDSAPHATHSSA
jgi:hypothetical protein